MQPRVRSMLVCPVCPGRPFSSPVALQQHQSDLNHLYCRTCRTPFSDYKTLFDHASVMHSRTCSSCRRIFTSEAGVKRHLFDSPKHPKCRSCRIGFQDQYGHNAHKAEVHDNGMASPRRESKKTQEHKPSSATFTDNSSTFSLSLLSQRLPSSSKTPDVDIDEWLQALLSPSQSALQGMPPTSSAHVPEDVELPPSFFISPKERNEQGGSHDAVTHGGVQKVYVVKNKQLAASQQCVYQTSVHDDCGRSTSPHSIDERASEPSLAFGVVCAESGETDRPDDNPQDQVFAFADMTIDSSSPLLESSLTPPSNSISDTSAHREDSPTHFRFAGELDGLLPSPTAPKESLPASNFAESDLWGKPASFSSSRLSEAMGSIRPAWRLRCDDEVMRSASSRRIESPSSIKTGRAFSRISMLPTISDESEIEEEQELEYDPELLVQLVVDASEVQVLKRLASRRKRRLSLSPTLPSIPEAAAGHDYGFGLLSMVDADYSDSDSSRGIIEYRAGDILYDSLSENELCQSPMTYLTADELDFDDDVGRNLSHPSSPVIHIEKLAKFTEEMDSPSTADVDFFDPSADPFDLHPSANNSPMNATFPKRPRAWSLGLPVRDAQFLSPEGSNAGTHDPASRNGDGNHVALRDTEVDVEEPDEAAVAADGSPSTVIEEDLFSEPDEIMQPISQDTHDSNDARFAEEDHPLRSIISLDTLPLIGRDRPETARADPPSSSTSLQQSRSSTPNVSNTTNHESSLEQKPILRCRLCQVDPCQEVTATFCGHLFCNRCITQEIMATSKCPVCSTPTLLYCLFKLDLDS